MTLLNRIENITRLWELVVPHIAKPSASWISRWCVYPDPAIERGIIRAAKKFAPHRADTVPDPDLVYQYVCGVARNEFEGRDARIAHQTGQITANAEKGLTQ